MLVVIYGYASPEELVASLANIERQLYVDPRRRGEFVDIMSEHETVTDFESQMTAKTAR